MSLTPDDITVLRAIAKSGGRDVSFSQVRGVTGFTRQKSRYRWSKLVDDGHIIQHYVDEEGASERTGTLADSARQALNEVDDEYDEAPDEVSKEALWERVQTLERRLDVLVANQSTDLADRVDNLADGLNRTGDDVGYLECVSDAIWAHHSDHDDRDFHEALEEIAND